MGEMSWPARFTTPKLTVYQIPEESSLENIIIHWTFNLENFYFKVIDKGEVVVAKTKETSITLPAPSFGKQNPLHNGRIHVFRTWRLIKRKPNEKSIQFLL